MSWSDTCKVVSLIPLSAVEYNVVVVGVIVQKGIGLNFFVVTVKESSKWTINRSKPFWVANCRIKILTEILKRISNITTYLLIKFTYELLTYIMAVSCNVKMFRHFILIPFIPVSSYPLQSMFSLERCFFLKKW